MATIAIDIDGTLRNLQYQIIKYLEIDHPDKLDKFKEIKDDTYYSLDEVFESTDDVKTWLYEERPFELFGQAPRLHPKIIDDLNFFTKAAEDQGFSVIIASVQRDRSITSTLHWLSKWGCRVNKYVFFNNMQDKINANFDLYVDDCPLVLEAFDTNRVIKIPYGFTESIDCKKLDISNGKFDDIYDILNVEKILKKQ